MEGTLVKYQKDTNDNLFFAEMKNKVKNYFLVHNKKEYGDKVILTKSFFLLLLFFGSYGLLITNRFSPFGTLLLGIICGLSSILIVFNISHDASHNCLFRNRKLNKFFTYTFNLVGGNAYVWNLAHNQIHHGYPNVIERDPDIYQSSPFLRITTVDPFRPYHRFQHFYATFLYLTHSIYLVFMKDFQIFRMLPKKEVCLPIYKHPISSYIVLFTTKLFYVFYSLVIPLIVLNISWWKIILGYLLIHVLMSILLSVVLIPVHMVDENEFPSAGSNHKIEHSWVRHVFETTIDYSYRNKLANFFFGGLNTHLAHHLFPHVCHVHLIDVTDIIRAEAKRHGMPYRNVSMWQAVKSHYRLLKRMSSPTH